MFCTSSTAEITVASSAVRQAVAVSARVNVPDRRQPTPAPERGRCCRGDAGIRPVQKQIRRIRGIAHDRVDPSSLAATSSSSWRAAQHDSVSSPRETLGYGATQFGITPVTSTSIANDLPRVQR